MRKRDLHILTSSIHTYTGDGRFSVHHPENSDDWDLQIEYVQRRDSGIYECQVNTEPKINMRVELHVEDAQAAITGPTEVFVKKGSTISLTCSVNVHSNPPSSVLWYHGSSKVDFDSPRGGISLETEKTEAGTTSKLLITKALLSDSGNYTCQPSNASPAFTIVHVLNGEHPAAMQTSRGDLQSHLMLLTSFSSILVLVSR
ncbi:zwei Ig domain protein zig-8 [Agrilus planipennis]|uniref:Zwei Ig domain protein zig-8 n=1 Tax=Agrilus planipennis TaxID=224129 RepID=A0A1W4WTC3_AGRPL|nr:zwei Ig domain protein zig-8 [Agrilus planipennis]